MENSQSQRISLPLFFVLLFIVSWIGTLPMILSSYKIAIPRPLGILQILMLFGPGIVATLTAWRNEGSSGVKSLLKGLVRWRVNIGWYVAVLVGPAFLFSASLLLSNKLGWTSATFPAAPKFFTAFLMTFLVYFILNTEEIAWRGYALPRLQSRFGALKATAIIGALWMVFHIPLFLLRGGHPAGYPFWLFALMILGWTTPFTSVYNGTAGSILLVHILHQSLNAAAEALPVFPIAAKSISPMLISSILSFLLSIILIQYHRLGFARPENR